MLKCPGVLLRYGLAIIALAVCPTSLGAEPASRTRVDFVQHIQPILRKHCYQCHGPEVQEAGLRVDVQRDALAGSTNGPVIVPGQPDQSLLVKLISKGGLDGRFMPPPDEFPPLDRKDVTLIRQWIQAGAEWPVTEESPDHDQDLWSFSPVRRPPLPPAIRADWAKNPIDAFVLEQLEAAGLEPAPPANSSSLVRRASFDLLGLPPQIGDVEGFLGDGPQQQAFERFIDELLASPHYGERWGRHWLDLVRYADSNGYEVDGTKPMAWKYRDYVIRALNKDTPYDHFIMEQLAGDELADATSETVIATGFYRVGPWDAERGASVQPSEVVAERYNELDDMVSTTSQVFLGLTLGCARCHNHKFDPLTAHDYYSMVSIFRPLTRHRQGRSELTRPAVPPSELKEKNAADSRIDALKKQIFGLSQPLRRGLLNSGRSKLSEDAVTAFLADPDQRTKNQQQMVDRFRNTLDQRVTDALDDSSLASNYLTPESLQKIAAAQRQVAELANRFDYPSGYFLFESSPQAPVTHLLKRGNPNQPGEVVQPAVPAAIVSQSGKPQPDFEQPDDFTSRRRVALARWIAAPDNPLTARVMVNRIWQFHFGLGLVRTPSDFGRRGGQPTHPDLLDWLADWFARDANWSLKRLHRLIMTSNTYRMGKFHSNSPPNDPDNRLWWHVPYRRLEAEAIRDSILAVSGQLDPALYGPSMYPYIPQDARRSGYNPESVWKEFDERAASRRTIYTYVKRTLIVPFLETLDFCETTRSADRRDVTTVAPQALELLNGDFVNRQAKHFAQRLVRDAGADLEEQIAFAFRVALSRGATTGERQALMQFWQQERTAYLSDGNVSESEADHRALTQVCRVIFNLNEFVYTD